MIYDYDKYDYDKAARRLKRESSSLFVFSHAISEQKEIVIRWRYALPKPPLSPV